MARPRATRTRRGAVGGLLALLAFRTLPRALVAVVLVLDRVTALAVANNLFCFLWFLR